MNIRNIWKQLGDFSFTVLLPLTIAVFILSLLAEVTFNGAISRAIFSTNTKASQTIEIITPITYMDYATLIVGLGTLIALIVAGTAYWRQADAMTGQIAEHAKQALAMEDQVKIARLQNQQDRFNDAINLLSLSNEPYQWFIGLDIVKTIAINNPEKFYKTTIKSLIHIGRAFSTHLERKNFEYHDSTKMERWPTIRLKGHLTESNIEPGYIASETYYPLRDKNNFIIEILTAISDIHSHPQTRMFYTYKFIISNFYIAIGSITKKHKIRDADFSYFDFRYCNFRGIVFEGCNFYKVHFFNMKNTSLQLKCLLSGSKFSPLEHQEAEFTNQFNDKEQFNLNELYNYIWQQDIGNLTIITDEVFKESFRVIKSGAAQKNPERERFSNFNEFYPNELFGYGTTISDIVKLNRRNK